jgi:sigma-B regulation protein RsbU (phosphoserine phosphatase)
MYTDGVTELNDEAGDEFGTDRLAAVVRESHRQELRWLIDRIHERMVQFARSHRFDDDSTLVVLRRLPGEPASGGRAAVE